MEGKSADKPHTRCNKPLIDLKTHCMFCGCKKRKKEAKLVLIQFESAIQNIEKQCDLKEDQELRRTIGGDFSKLPAFDAKYHPNCYKSYMREHKEQEREKVVHDICFEYLIPEIDAYIQSCRAVKLKVLLERYKEYLQQQEYENFDSYTVQNYEQKSRNIMEIEFFLLTCHIKDNLYTIVK